MYATTNGIINDTIDIAVNVNSLDELLARPIEQWQGVVKNDFEAHIFKSHPLLGNLKQQLLDAGAIYASMSGSGSALFGIFDCRPEINFDSTIFTHIEQL